MKFKKIFSAVVSTALSLSLLASNVTAMETNEELTLVSESVTQAIDLSQLTTNASDEPYEVSENRPAFFEDIMCKVYNQYADALSSITGIRSEYLNEADESSPLFDRSGRTEENFVQKATERIEYIESHSRGLRDTVEQYCKVQKLSNEARSDDFSMTEILLAKLYIENK